jgi:hypothetical protein
MIGARAISARATGRAEVACEEAIRIPTELMFMFNTLILREPQSHEQLLCAECCFVWK